MSECSNKENWNLFNGIQGSVNTLYIMIQKMQQNLTQLSPIVNQSIIIKIINARFSPYLKSIFTL